MWETSLQLKRFLAILTIDLLDQRRHKSGTSTSSEHRNDPAGSGQGTVHLSLVFCFSQWPSTINSTCTYPRNMLVVSLIPKSHWTARSLRAFWMLTARTPFLFLRLTASIEKAFKSLDCFDCHLLYFFSSSIPFHNAKIRTVHNSPDANVSQSCKNALPHWHFCFWFHS